MKRRVIVALALAAAAAAGTASADTRAYVTVTTPQPVYVQHERYGPPLYAYDANEYDQHRHRRDCQAERWDPNARYMPGQAVWRKGRVYVATDVSRNVYNVNSPPEWTPNYWRPARCR